MAKQMTPAQMKSQFLRWEVDLRLYPGWETRGYGPNSIFDAEGILIHHTGSDGQSDDYLDFLFVRGRPGDVPAPLCNWATDMDGELWLGAAERANHAGKGSGATLDKIKTGNYDWRNREIAPGPDTYVGNGYLYGNEVRFDGGQPMTAAAWRTVVLSSAAVCEFHHWGAERVIGHREHTRRKPDPGSTLMYMLRRDVDAALRAGPGNWPVKQSEDDEMTPAQMTELKNFIEARTKAYALATNEYVRQVLSTATKTIVDSGGDAKAAIAALDAELDARDAEMLDRLAKIGAELEDPVTPPKA
jgi:hypothetical protein